MPRVCSDFSFPCSLVRRFHVLLKRQAQIKQKLSTGDGGDGTITALRSELTAVEQEMVDLGGLEWYQRGAFLLIEALLEVRGVVG